MPALGEEHHDDHHNHHGHHGHAHHEAYYAHDLPTAVVVSLGNRYNHFDLIHTRRVYRRGQLNFDLILQHRSGFVRVSLGDRGHFYHDTYYDQYPLANHYCDEYCGFDYLHYEGGNFVDYDPYYGCSAHVSLIVNRFPRYVYRPYYGYGSLYYHPQYRWYKRFRQYDPYYNRGYYVHKRPRRYYQYKNYGYGYRNGHGNRAHKYRPRAQDNRGHYRSDRRGQGRYQQRTPQRGRQGQERRYQQGSEHRKQGGEHRKYDHRDNRRDRTYEGRDGRGNNKGYQNRGQNDARKQQQRQSREQLDRQRGKERYERPRGQSGQRERRRSS